MDQAPARVDIVVAQEPVHRTLPGCRLHLGHLGDLFGDMDVDRRQRVQQGRHVQPLRTDRAQRMRGDTQNGVGGQGFQADPRRLPQGQELVGVSAKAQLPRRQRAVVTAAAFIKHRQMGQAQPGLSRRRRNPRGHLGQIGIMSPPRRVVQIVKLGHRSEPSFGHFDHHHGGDGLHVVRRQLVEKSVHQRPPGPETVLPRRTPLGQPCHGALKGVGVQVGGRCQQAIDALPRSRHPGGHAGNASAGNLDEDIGGPAVGQQRSLGVNKGHGWP